MPKFYVETGKYRIIVDAPNIRDGAKRGLSKIIDKHTPHALGLLTLVSESGFDEECNKDDSRYVETRVLLSELGLPEP